MNFSIVKILLISLTTGTYAQGFGLSGNSINIQSESSLSSESSWMQTFSGLSGISSLSESTQQSIAQIFSTQYNSGSIDINQFYSQCGSVCSQNTQVQSDISSLIQSFNQQRQSINIGSSANYISTFKNIGLYKLVNQIDASFAQRFSACFSGMESILAGYISSASRQPSITIDINQFRSIFGEYFVQQTVSELQSVITNIFRQIGCQSSVNFNSANYYQQNMQSLIQQKQGFSQIIESQIQQARQLDYSSFRKIVNQATSQYNNCQVCKIEGDSLLRGFNSLSQRQSSASLFKTEISSAVRSFQSSSSMGFSSFGSLGCSTC